ncbi:MAG: hypothetical protein ACI9CD_000312 [Candidatus Deianiraeaceae bacterium]|jgi:hypothetical protein
MILSLNGINVSAETAIDEKVPTATPKKTITQKLLMSPFAKRITGIIAKRVVIEVPIVRGIVEEIEWFNVVMKSDLGVREERILSYIMTVSLIEYPMIVKIAAMIVMPKSICNIFMKAMTTTTS